MKQRDMRNLERQIEDRMRLLDALPEVEPSEAGVERVKARVVREAERLEMTRRRMRYVRTFAGVAAAGLLALVFPWSASDRAVQDTGPDATLNDWAVAWQDSAASVVEVLGSGAVAFGQDENGQLEAELDAYFESMNQSFDAFDSL
jgi:hypothetical protein